MPGFQTITATTVSNQVATVKGNLSRMTIFRAVPLATPSATAGHAMPTSRDLPHFSASLATPSATAGHAIGMEKPSTNRAQPPAVGADNRRNPGKRKHSLHCATLIRPNKGDAHRTLNDIAIAGPPPFACLRPPQTIRHSELTGVQLQNENLSPVPGLSGAGPA